MRYGGRNLEVLSEPVQFQGLWMRRKLITGPIHLSVIPRQRGSALRTFAFKAGEPAFVNFIMPAQGTDAIAGRAGRGRTAHAAGSLALLALTPPAPLFFTATFFSVHCIPSLIGFIDSPGPEPAAIPRCRGPMTQIRFYQQTEQSPCHAATININLLEMRWKAVLFEGLFNQIYALNTASSSIRMQIAR
jgi:hypothetical protein